MKRKISANIELKAIELKADLRNSCSTDHDSRFLSSEVISCYYEYPVRFFMFFVNFQILSFKFMLKKLSIF